jgi:hypothetical protein
MIFETKFPNGVRLTPASQLSVAVDGSSCAVYYEPDADGLRRGEYYVREGDCFVLRSHALYRLDADGTTWSRVGEAQKHEPLEFKHG